MVLLGALIAVLLLNSVGLLIAFKKQSDKLTDASYALSFMTVAIIGLLLAPSPSTELYILFTMILLWAVRIGGFLLIRVIKKGKDARFDTIRTNFVKFGKFWIGQAFASWIIMLPFLLFAGLNSPTSATAWVGLLIWLVGFVLETIADTQKYRFSNKASNKNKWIDEGVWQYSRHPNYLGEILVWVGVYVYCVGSFNFWQGALGLLSPLFIAGLLLFVSGIPILEKAADERWGKNKEYIKYKQKTGVLLPRF